MSDKAKCPGCGDDLPEPVMCSISHTIKPGAKLCVACGQRETTDPAWANGIKTGHARANACNPTVREKK